MTTLQPTVQNQIENRAYFNYLKRQQTNEPGDAYSDWLKAVREVELAQAKTRAQNLKSAAAAEELPPVAVSPALGDDLTVISGIGRKFAQDLVALGINSYAQIASWSVADIQRMFPRQASRIIRDQWVEQAQKLLQG